MTAGWLGEAELSSDHGVEGAVGQLADGHRGGGAAPNPVPRPGVGGGRGLDDGYGDLVDVTGDDLVLIRAVVGRTASAIWV